MITRPPMSPNERKVFDFFAAHPLRKPEDAISEIPHMDAEVILNAIYFLYFNTYLLKDLKFKGCYSVNPFIEQELAQA